MVNCSWCRLNLNIVCQTTKLNRRWNIWAWTPIAEKKLFNFRWSNDDQLKFRTCNLIKREKKRKRIKMCMRSHIPNGFPIVIQFKVAVAVAVFALVMWMIYEHLLIWTGKLRATRVMIHHWWTIMSECKYSHEEASSCALSGFHYSIDNNWNSS